jgi:cell division initiation protein
VKLTPLEVRKQAFRKTMRGFDPEEVRIFLDMVADEYERILQENGMLSEKVRYLNERLEEYHNLEKTLQNSILTAERVAAESRERSRLEAETIINDAHVRAERILEDSRNRLRRLGDQVNHLSSQKDLFVQRFQSLLDGQMQFLRGNQEDLGAVDELATETSELIKETARAIAPPPTEPEAEAAERASGLVSDTPRIKRAHPPEPGGEEPQQAEEVDRQADEDEARHREAWGLEQEDAETENGFFQPAERSEGFFELDASPDAAGQGKGGAEEGAQR